ncbi:MAG: hypothetical protein AB1728_13290 [Bacteroidota bacterium]
MKLFELGGRDSQNTNANDVLRNEVIQNMRLATQLFEVAEFYTHAGNADKPRKAATETGGAQRQINSPYVGNTGAPSYGDVALKIYGDELKTDVAYERRGIDIDSERVRELRSFAKALGRHIMNHFVNGVSADATQIVGLKERITGSQLVSLEGAGNGYQVLFGSDNTAKKSQQAFLRAIDELIARSGAQALFLDAKTIAYIKAIGREYVSVSSIEGIFSLPVERYNNVLLVNAGYAKDGVTNVIAHNETLGTSNDCTSIYAVKFGEKEDTTFATNVGVQVIDKGVVGSQYVTMVDFDIDLAVLNPWSAMRLQGIRLA